MTDTTKQNTTWLIGVMAFILQGGALVYYTGAANAQITTEVKMLTQQVSELNSQLREMRQLSVDVAVLKSRSVNK